MVLNIRPGADQKKKQMVIEEWYRREIKYISAPLITKWEKIMSLKVEQYICAKNENPYGEVAILKRAVFA